MDEDQTTNPNSAPTWADFKPPVMTTPFANGESLNIPVPEASPAAPVENSSESLSQGFQSPALPDSSVESAPNSFPIETAEPAPTTSPVSNEVRPPVDAAIPEPAPSAIETAAAQVLTENDPPPTTPSSATPDKPVTVATEPVSAEPISQVPVTPIPAILETPELPVGDPNLASPLAPTPVPTPPSTAPSGRSFWPWLIVSLVVVLALGGLGYLYYNNSQVGPIPTTSQNGGENLTILQDSPGPDSWEKNYSTSLLASERGGMEFVVTDPPATPSAMTSDKAASPTASVSDSKVGLSSLKINISKIEVHLSTQSVIATGTAPDATKSATKNIDRWETLRLNNATTIDLMQLRQQGGGLSSLGVTYLAAGHYTEIRLYVTSASGVLTDGTNINITVPGQNGIVKLVKSFDVSATGTSKLIVDFDAPNSVVKAGSNYQLTPVVGKVIFNSQEI